MALRQGKVCQIRFLGQEIKGQQDQGIHDVITHATPTVIHQRLADIGTAQVTASAPIGILAATYHSGPANSKLRALYRLILLHRRQSCVRMHRP